MTSNDQHIPDEQALDRQWDELVTGRAPVTAETLLRDLHAAPQPGGPSPLFRAQLRSLIETAAHDQMPTRRTPATIEPTAPEPIRNARLQPVLAPARPRYARMRGLSSAGKAASVLLAASLLVAMLAAVVRYPFGGSNGTDSPATGAQTAIPAASGSPGAVDQGGPSSADPGRTNEQPGPAPMGIPQIVGHADITGSAMALGGNTIVIVSNDTITALDAKSLDQKWSVEVPYGVYTTPVIAGDAVYFGFTGQRDGTTEWLLGPDQPNQLVSLSLKDGSEDWRIDGAGAYPVAPLVVNGTIYAVGTTKDAYRLGAFDAIDGRTLWTAESFNRQATGGDPVIPYLWMSVAYGDSAIVVNDMHELFAFDVTTGKTTWTQVVEDPDTLDRPIIADGSVFLTFGHDPRGDGSLGEGTLAAFDLRSGDRQWATPLETGITWSQALGSGAVIVAEVGNVNEYRLSAFGATNGSASWTAPSWDRGADPGPDFSQMPDSVVVAGKQIVTLGIASSAGRDARTLVTARDIATGDVDWTVVIDGSANAAPIIAGGKIFVLTDLYGLQALGGTETTATPRAGTADLRGPNECAPTPIENPLLSTPEANGTPIPAWARWGEVMPLSAVPQFDPAEAVSPDVAAAIEDAIAGYRACMVEGDPQLLFGFFSADYYQRIRDLNMGAMDGKNGESGQQAVMLAGSNERIDLDPATLQTWPAGRVGGIVHGNTDMYVWFVEEDGAWKVDEFHHIMDISPMPEESPSPAE